jgi:hypothetical protein
LTRAHDVFRRLAWFVGLWVLGVASVGLLSLALRWWLQ